MSGASITAEPPVRGAPPASAGGRWRRYAVAAAFLGPAALFLIVWIIYPAIYTFVQSLYRGTGFSDFAGIDNYKTLFTSDNLVRAIKNNAIWVVVVPAAVTALGLIFAVLTERVRWSVAFKTVVFMPMAVSAFAAGVTWRIMYQQEPDRGAINAAIASVKGVFSPEGVLSQAAPSSENLKPTSGGGIELTTPIGPGDVARLGLTRIRSTEVPETAKQAVEPEPRPGGITGVVWRDSKPVGGVSWLSAQLITPAVIIAYVWIWAGFAMVVIAAGLAAIPRDVLEAARTDGAGEWQVFRRVTVPLLAPILSVVFITMLINVLKVFDIVVAVAPQSTQAEANVIALAMWRTSFGGVNDFGLGSAIAVFLFLLVLPVLALNVRRFRREV